MSAADLDFFTIVVPNPQFDNSKSAQIINGSISYQLGLTNNFQTLSGNNPNNYPVIEGLLYVPNIDNANCRNTSIFSIPQNVTNENSFPQNQDYPLVALFPWAGGFDCVSAYLAAARADAVHGVVTFSPTAQQVPGAGSTQWDIGDADAWKKDNQFPIYAISTADGSALTRQLSLYSGNMTDAPFADQLVDEFGTRDFPRIFTRVDLTGGTSVPSLWIFLIIVLAILLGIVIFASIIMHLIQRRQRHVLQRRLQRGEIDLESLGIKRMNVPQEEIDKMPKFVYMRNGTAQPADSTTATAENFSTSSQPTCPICLDDFAHGETSVRQLPCNHIFHPECIDPFLRDNSSLCPMCKKSALPAGFCPVKVTNLMVRRERLTRRMAERRRHNLEAGVRRAQREDAAANGHPDASLLARVKRRFSRKTPPSPTQPGPPSTDTEHGAVEMTSPPSNLEARGAIDRRETMIVPEDVNRQGVAARRAWRRERLARQQQAYYDHQAEQVRVADEGRPWWRRVAGRIIPGVD